MMAISGVDPLNLAGIVTPGEKLAAFAGNRALYRDGIPIAFLSAGEIRFFETLGHQKNGRPANCCAVRPLMPHPTRSETRRLQLLKLHGGRFSPG